MYLKTEGCDDALVCLLLLTYTGNICLWQWWIEEEMKLRLAEGLLEIHEYVQCM